MARPYLYHFALLLVLGSQRLSFVDKIYLFLVGLSQIYIYIYILSLAFSQPRGLKHACCAGLMHAGDGIFACLQTSGHKVSIRLVPQWVVAPRDIFHWCCGTYCSVGY